jgi:hypothetical protein
VVLFVVIAILGFADLLGCLRRATSGPWATLGSWRRERPAVDPAVWTQSKVAAMVVGRDRRARIAGLIVGVVLFSLLLALLPTSPVVLAAIAVAAGAAVYYVDPRRK